MTWVRLATAVATVAALAGCGSEAAAPPPTPSETLSPAGAPITATANAPTPTAAPPVADPEHAVDPPGPLKERLWYADLLVTSARPLGADAIAAIDALRGVDQTESVSIGQVGIENQVFTVAAVDPATYRRYTDYASAYTEAVWDRVAGGELAVAPGVRKLLDKPDGMVRLGNDQDAPEVHIGAYAKQIPRVDAVVNEKWGSELGMPAGNALLVSTGLTAPEAVRPAIERILGDSVSVQLLGPVLDAGAPQTAVLTGGSVAEAVGTFTYRVLGGGRIQPDPGWVRENIRTEDVPILGSVTCHKAMLPQLRAALTEIAARGLADKIHPEEYAGCYYPRFIAGTTRLSLHSFGIAVDLNVPGNQRGTVGEIDRTVVSIFQDWGFTWGGNWSYTDPMHFEMGAVVEPR